ncbi:MAG: Ig-like domain-containing protein [Abditibacteriota bacterium]|nr:Ig-like domain-containing protein [Abditibacteriota bacterium]
MKKLFTAIIIILLAGALRAQELSPLNPDYVNRLLFGEPPVKTAAGGHRVTGYTPPEFDSWTLPEDTGLKHGILPEAYDLRDEKRVPPVRNQDPYGICWAFGAVGSLEGWYMTLHPNSSIEYSTFNLVRWCSDIFGSTLDSGGNNTKATAYFAMLEGPVLAEDDPFIQGLPADSVPPAPERPATVRGFITQAEYVPVGGFNGSDSLVDGTSLRSMHLDYIKQLVIDKGIVDFAIYYDDRYLRKSSDGGSAYYYRGTEETNHVVSIIGWDDNYDCHNFRNVPVGNGAWLARNSWGTGWGDGGYFWVSYYDKSARNYCKFTHTLDTTLYNRIYFKEKKGLTQGARDCIWGKSVFCPDHSGILVDAATYVLAGGRDVTCYVTVNGDRKPAVTKHIDYPGYYLFRSNAQYAVGDTVEICFKYDSRAEEDVTYVPLCNDVSYCSSGSFISADGEKWDDTLTIFDDPYAVCIKAYCKNTDRVRGISLDRTSLTLEMGDTASLKATVAPSDAADKSVEWSSDDTSVAGVSGDGLVKAVNPGTAVITAKTVDGGFTAKCKVTVTRTVPVTGVSLDVSKITLCVGDTRTLRATVSPADATNQQVRWMSSNTEVATVDKNGAVTAVGEGEATVKTKTVDGGFTANCKVTVTKPVAVTGVTLDAELIELFVGESRLLTATVLPENAADKGVTWSCNYTDIAEVARGLVTAKKSGIAEITAKTDDGGFTAKCYVLVSDPVPVTGITLDKETLTLYEGETKALTATVLPENAANKNVFWSSGNSSAATVSREGGVTGVKAGSAVITAETADGGFTATCKVTVKKKQVPVTGIRLNTDFLKLEKGATGTLLARIVPSDATVKALTWSTDDKAIATVSSKGVVTAVGPGTTKVRVKTRDGGFTAKCKVRVVISATGVELDKTTLKLRPGNTYTLKANVLPADATNKEVTWMTYDPSVAVVDSNGCVKAVGVGETRIRVKTRDGGFKAKCKVKVAVPVTGIALNKLSVTVNKGSSVTLKATVSPSDATDKTVTWISYDTAIATVDGNGRVKGIKPGSTTVRAKTKDGGYTAKCKVTVK